MNMKRHAAALAVWLVSSTLLLASCDRQAVSRNVRMAPCVADLKRAPGTSTRLLSGREIESCIRGNKLAFYASNGGAYLNRTESFLSDGTWVVDLHMAILDTRVGQWHMEHDKVCITRAESGPFCRTILFNQSDQSLFMPQSDYSVDDRAWAQISIASSPYEGHMRKP